LDANASMPGAGGFVPGRRSRAPVACLTFAFAALVAIRADAGPHLEAGQRWQYESPPKEYSGVLTILSYDGTTAVISVRYLFSQPSQFVQVELSAADLEKALEKPADPEHEQAPDVQSPFPCRVHEYGLVECLQAVHILRNLE